MVNGFMIFTGVSVSPPLRFGFSVVAVRFLRCYGSVTSLLRTILTTWTIITNKRGIDNMNDNNEYTRRQHRNRNTIPLGDKIPPSLSIFVHFIGCHTSPSLYLQGFRDNDVSRGTPHVKHLVPSILSAFHSDGRSGKSRSIGREGVVDYLPSSTSRTLISEGEMPGMREAWARVSGRRAVNFWRASVDRLWMLL